MSAQITTGASSQMQLVCCVTLELGHYLSRVLWISGCGLDREASGGVANDPTLGGVLQNIMMNGVVGTVFPALQDDLVQMFEVVDAPNHRVKIHVVTFGAQISY